MKSHGKQPKTSEELTEKQKSRIENTWYRRHSGTYL
jgi:hypothetical protein